MTATYCRSCANLPGCALVQHEDGTCTIDAFITEENSRHCDEWSSLDNSDLRVRATILEYCGIGGLRAINQAPTILRDLQETDDMTEVPDFIDMIYEGMTVDEREHQLRFEESPNGNPLPRNSFPLRKYASDPEGPLAKSVDVVMFWSVDQLVKSILKAELEAGWITKPKKTRKKEDMATSRKITIRKPTSAKGKSSKVPAKALGGKVSKPATKKKKVVSKDNGVSEVPTAAVGPDITEALVEALLPISQAIADLKAGQAQLGGQLDSVRDDTVTSVTVLHDVIIKLQGLEETEEQEMSLIHQGMNIMNYTDTEGNE